MIFSDNATAFMAASVQNFMRSKGVAWKAGIAYALMANWMAGRMVDTIKNAFQISVVKSGGDWAEKLPKLFYGHCHRDRGPNLSLFRMTYCNSPRMLAIDAVALLTDVGHHHRLLDNFSESGVRATAATRSGEARNGGRKENKFDIGDEFLVAHDPAFNKTRNWDSFELYFYGPCRVTIVDHLRYKLVSSTGHVTLQGIHSRRLARYENLPARLLK